MVRAEDASYYVLTSLLLVTVAISAGALVANSSKCAFEKVNNYDILTTVKFLRMPMVTVSAEQNNAVP